MNSTMASSENEPSRKEEILELLRDPLTKNKSKLLEELKEISKKVDVLNYEPYYCTKCHFYHHGGEIFLAHVDHVGFRTSDLLPLKIHACEWACKIHLDDVYALNTQEYCKKIPYLDKITFRKDRYEDAITVYHRKNRIGKIHSNNNIMDEWNYCTQFSGGRSIYMQSSDFSRFRNLSNWIRCPHFYISAQWISLNWRIKHDHYFPSYLHDYFRNIFGLIQVHVIDWNLYEKLTDGLFELHELEYPGIIDIVKRLSPKLRMNFQKNAEERGYHRLVSLLNRNSPSVKQEKFNILL